MKHSQPRFADAFRLLQSFPGHVHNELVPVCSPLDSQDATDVVLALALQLLGNFEELAVDLELVIGVKLQPRRVDVAQSGCGEVLNFVHVLFVVVGNTSRSDPSGHELAVLALSGYSSRQNIIAYSEIWQSLDARPHAVPLKPSHRCIDLAASSPLQMGTYQQSFLQRVGPGRHPDHAMAMAFHPRQPFVIRRSHPHPGTEGGSVFRSGCLHAAHNIFRLKLVVPSKMCLRVLDAQVHADRIPRPASPYSTAGFSGVYHRQGCARQCT